MKHTPRLGFLIGMAGLCLVAGLVGAVLSRSFGTSSYTISYADFISVMLTAISLIMTLLAFFIAILAYIGWNSISGKVASEVKAFLADGFREGQPLHNMLIEQKDKAMFEGVMEIDTDFQDDAAAEEREGG
ncbi:hypothetical protein [Brevundimonas sp.]|jgi:hypothetical protein|uniref:hypothetical protein n=1 Tax=Brevundimonas sp. TaxID=1871086 RepID=UPI00391A1483